MGTEGPIKEYSSREMPSGFLTLDKFARFGCDSPAEMLVSRDRALRMSMAEAFMAVSVKCWSRVHDERRTATHSVAVIQYQLFSYSPAATIAQCSTGHLSPKNCTLDTLAIA